MSLMRLTVTSFLWLKFSPRGGVWMGDEEPVAMSEAVSPSIAPSGAMGDMPSSWASKMVNFLMGVSILVENAEGMVSKTDGKAGRCRLE